MGKVTGKKAGLEKNKEVVEGEDKVQKLTGLEFWFSPRSSYRTESEENNIRLEYRLFAFLLTSNVI
jgi:antibiotic biosynthesis monooxygenase (ABM) superfamily enzyme